MQKEDNGGHDGLTKVELLTFKKECLIEEAKMREQGIRARFVHHWQIRLLFTVFSGSFLGLCFANVEIRNLQIPICQQLLGTLLLTAVFFLLRNITF